MPPFLATSQRRATKLCSPFGLRSILVRVGPFSQATSKGFGGWVCKICVVGPLYAVEGTSPGYKAGVGLT